MVFVITAFTPPPNVEIGRDFIPDANNSLIGSNMSQATIMMEITSETTTVGHNETLQAVPTQIMRTVPKTIPPMIYGILLILVVIVIVVVVFGCYLILQTIHETITENPSQNTDVRLAVIPELDEPEAEEELPPYTLQDEPLRTNTPTDQGTSFSTIAEIYDQPFLNNLSNALRMTPLTEEALNEQRANATTKNSTQTVNNPETSEDPDLTFDVEFMV